MFVGRTGKHLRQQARVKQILWVGIILRHLLLDGAPLLAPQRVGGEDVAHAHRLDAQRGFEIAGWHGEKILRDDLLGVCIEIAAHGRNQTGKLCGRKSGAAAKHHMLQRVGHAGKAVRSFVGTD